MNIFKTIFGEDFKPGIFIFSCFLVLFIGLLDRSIKNSSDYPVESMQIAEK